MRSSVAVVVSHSVFPPLQSQSQPSSNENKHVQGPGSTKLSVGLNFWFLLEMLSFQRNDKAKNPMYFLMDKYTPLYKEKIIIRGLITY